MTGTTVGAATAAAAALETLPWLEAPLCKHLPLLRTAGTWTGITDNLDLLQDMGMTAVSLCHHQTARTVQYRPYRQAGNTNLCSRPVLCICAGVDHANPIPVPWQDLWGVCLSRYAAAPVQPSTADDNRQLSLATQVYHDMQLEQAAASTQT